MTITITPTTTVEFIGDSVTEGGRFSDDEFGIGDGYVRRVFDRLRGNVSQVINRGISGNRSGDLVARWQSDCLDLRPDVLSIMIGINDTWRRYDHDDPTSTELFEQNYRTLLTSTSQELDARIVLVEPFLLTVRPEQEKWREDLDPKIDVVRRLAAEFGHTLLPLDAILQRESETHGNEGLAADGVHPTPLGHQVIAQAWLSLVN